MREPLDRTTAGCGASEGLPRDAGPDSASDGEEALSAPGALEGLAPRATAPPRAWASSRESAERPREGTAKRAPAAQFDRGSPSDQKHRGVESV